MAKPQPALKKTLHLNGPAPSKNTDDIEMEWMMIQDLGFGNYSIRLDDTDIIITAYIGGKMKMNLKWRNILLVGDRVRVKLSQQDRSKWIITFRLRQSV